MQRASVFSDFYCLPNKVALMRPNVSPARKGWGIKEQVRAIFEAAFREYGLPLAIRTDNGPPFASRAVAGLSVLSICLDDDPERRRCGTLPLCYPNLISPYPVAAQACPIKSTQQN
jgi:hypothetical protein